MITNNLKSHLVLLIGIFIISISTCFGTIFIISDIFIGPTFL